MVIKKTGDIHFVSKTWGFEKWFANTKDYCGKLLYFVKDKKCSYHYHKNKHETFYVHKGLLKIEYGLTDLILDSNSIILREGETFEIEPGMRHRINALLDTELFEFSTHHEESDSYRVIPSS